MSTTAEPTRPKGHAAWLWATALLAIVIGLCAWPWLTGIVTIPWDAKAHAYAQLQFLAQSLHRGESPFWTPNVFTGSPQIADPQSLIFSPPFLLLALLDPNPGFQAADATVFAMLFAAGVAVLLLFRDRGWGPHGALVAAISMCLGGSAAWRLQHIGEVLSLCWFMIALWLLARALWRGSVPAGLAAGVAAGFMVAGRDQIAFVSMLVLAFYTAWTLLDGSGVLARCRRAALPLGAGFIGGIVTAGLPIALSIALAAQSNRPAIDFAGAVRGSLHPAAFLTLIASDIFGTAGPISSDWGPPFPATWGPNDLVLARNMGDLYLGALPFLALIALGVIGGRSLRREILPFTAAAVLLVLYAVGSYTPFFALVFHIPGVDLFRRPADATFPLCAMLSIIAGYCLDSYWRARAPSRWTSRAIPLAGLLALAFAGAVALSVGHFAQALSPLATAAFFFILAGSAIEFVRCCGSARPRVALLVLAGLLAFDLGVADAPNESTGLPPQTYDVLRPATKNDTVSLLKRLLSAENRPDRRDRIELAAIDFQWPNIGLVHGFDHDLGYNPIRLKLFEDVTHAEDQVAVPEQRVFSPLFPSYGSAMADLFGIRYIATGVPAEQIDRKLQPGTLRFVARTEDAYVYENPRAFPRVFVATSATRADFDEMIRTGIWPEADLHRTVLLEDPPPSSGPPAASSVAEARLDTYQNTRVEVLATAPDTGGWLVLLDVWHPWWVAEVDGVAAPIERANVMFRAVRLSAGPHHVVFRFEPFRGLVADIRRLFARQP